jgi:hypothetical protein
MREVISSSKAALSTLEPAGAGESASSASAAD